LCVRTKRPDDDLYIRVAPIGKRRTNLKQQLAIYLKEVKVEVNWFIGQYCAWRIPKENSSKQFEVWREIMDYQKSPPEKVYHARSRFFTFSSASRWNGLVN
jgi:hypothetical protein